MPARMRARPTRRIVLGSLVGLLILFSFAGAPAQDERPLLGTRLIGVEVVGDTKFDITLPNAFVLSGKILTDDPTSVIGSMVLARFENRVFSGGVTPSGLTAAYRIVLPAGSYRLYLERQIRDVDNARGSGEAVLRVLMDLSQTVAITGDHTLDLSIPDVPETISLSGRIRSSGHFPTKGILYFRSSDGNVLAQAPFDGEYHVRLLPGSYTVMANVSDIERGYTVQFRLDEIAVSASGVRDFTLPEAVELSGRVMHPTGQPAVPALVLASAAADGGNFLSNTGVPCENAGTILSSLPLTFAVTFIPRGSTTGAYRLLLPPGEYFLSAWVTLDPETATLIFPIPPRKRSLMADATQDFVMPELPPFVSLSGRITDRRGQPVGWANVSAFTRMLIGMPNAALSASARADMRGRYRLRLFRGTRYWIEICPPVISP